MGLCLGVPAPHRLGLEKPRHSQSRIKILVTVLTSEGNLSAVSTSDKGTVILVRNHVKEFCVNESSVEFSRGCDIFSSVPFLPVPVFFECSPLPQFYKSQAWVLSPPARGRSGVALLCFLVAHEIAEKACWLALVRLAAAFLYPASTVL